MWCDVCSGVGKDSELGKNGATRLFCKSVAGLLGEEYEAKGVGSVEAERGGEEVAERVSAWHCGINSLKGKDIILS